MFGQGQATPTQGTQIFGSSFTEGSSVPVPVPVPVPRADRPQPGPASSDATILAPPGGPVDASAESANKTMVFGSSGRASDESASRTVIFGAVALPGADSPAPAGGGASATNASPEGGDAAASSRTMVFGAASKARAADAGAANDEALGSLRSDQTLVFGKSRPATASAPAASAPSRAKRGEAYEPARATQMFGVPQLGHEPEAAPEVGDRGAPAVEIPAVPLPPQGMAEARATPESFRGPSDAPVQGTVEARQAGEPGQELEGSGSTEPSAAGEKPIRPVAAKGPSPVAVWPTRSSRPRPGCASSRSPTARSPRRSGPIGKPASTR